MRECRMRVVATWCVLKFIFYVRVLMNLKHAEVKMKELLIVSVTGG